MKKSAKEWFAQLPEPIRSQAVANWETSNYVNKNNPFNSLASALATFPWRDYEYWGAIQTLACKGEFDRPEPNLHGWISVKDRLPTKEDADSVGNVMIVSKDETVSIMPVVWVVANNAICPFWQPLPKLPEVKGGCDA